MFDFPSPVSVGATATNGSAVYQFDGRAWVVNGSFPATPPPTGTGTLWNNGGVLGVIDATWPTNTTGLAAGALWNNGGEGAVFGTTHPNPTAPPVYLSSTTSTALLALGGADMPLTSGSVGSGQLWNNGGVLCIS